MAVSIFDVLRPIFSTLFVPKQAKYGQAKQTVHVVPTIISSDNREGSKLKSSGIPINTPDVATSTTPHGPEKRRNAITLQRQMTSLGRFAMRSETPTNPSNITFFVALAHEAGKDLDLHDFQAVWAKRVMERHERFRCHVSSQDDRFFEVEKSSLEQENISRVKHPRHEKNELVKAIQSKGSSSMDVTKSLWEIELSSGPLGSSGAIPSDCILDLNKYNRETLAIFRVHHSLCDGVSLAVATGDATDEAAQLRTRILEELKKRTTPYYSSEGKYAYIFLLTTLKSFLTMLWLFVAGFYSLFMQFFRMVVSSSPFDPVISKSLEPEGQRTVAWRIVTSTEEMKLVGKSISSKITINDIGVAMVSHAIKCQLDDHATNASISGQNDKILSIQIPKKVNITVPVHLTGGILRPGDQLGNKIGGFVSSIPLPTEKHDDPRRRLYQISKVLHLEKKLPAPLISWHLAKLFTQFTPQWCTSWALRVFSANSVAVVSNVRGFPFGVHWLGRPVQFLCAFLPLPPGIPIGVVIQSYDGNISFGLHCDKRAVPDADKFAEWMLEEYARIKGRK